MRQIKILSISAFLILASSEINAQESTTASGGMATGAGGTAHFSVGQVYYSTVSGSNGLIAEGVQKPYEIYTIGLKETELSIGLSLYPNPTTEFLTLKIDDFKKMSYLLYDLKGEEIQKGQVNSTFSTINMNQLPNGTYFLRVLKEDQTINTYKIIKNK